ncbi:AMP-binding protein [bacterium]|nr:AMP-binding protein [bacterium]
MAESRTDSLTTLVDIINRFKERDSQIAVKHFNGFRVFRLSYAEFYNLCLQCANYLKKQGLQKGDKILIWAPNCPEWAVLQCACALTGIISVPLDVRNEAEFLQRVQEEVQAKFLFRTQFKRDPKLNIPTLFTESLLEFVLECPAEEQNNDIQPHDWMSIFYTSGTTGKPKGVILTHKNLATNIEAVLDIIPIDETYQLLSVLPLSHAFEQTAGFWSPLAGGGSILYLKTLKPSALFEMFQREDITVMAVVPRLLNLLKQRIEETLAEKHLGGYLRMGRSLAPALPRVMRKWFFYPVHKKIGLTFKFFVSGGASLPQDVELFWRAIGFEVIQGYGLTETSPILTAYGPGHGKVGSVGRAVKGVELTQSEKGEILAKGNNIFPGYYARPDATADIFENGWFKTGDVADRDADGYYYIRSRQKDIIVTADGVNIYPEDIEEVLNHHPGIKESCVIGIGEHEEIVHAAVIPEEGSNLDECVREANRQLSPEQKIQSYNLWPEADFPKTSTLKIKKNEVRKIVSGGEDAHKMETSLPLGTPLQQILSEVSNTPIDQINSDAKLGQDIGLSSINRVELISRLESEFRMDIDDQMVTADTTVGDLESIIENRRQSRTQLPLRRWTRSWPCHLFREAFRHTIMRAALAMFCQVKCQGLENLHGLKGPVLFVSNHTSHVDTPLIMQLAPYALGSRICPAAMKEYFDLEGKSFLQKCFTLFAWNFSTICMNIFPMAQKSGYRQSIVYAGELVDNGWNILLFPEGHRTEDGTVSEFLQGVGLMVRSLQIPLVPVAIQGGERILMRGEFLPKLGEVRIAFGQPFFPVEKSYNEITMHVKAQIMELFHQIDQN